MQEGCNERATNRLELYRVSRYGRLNLQLAFVNRMRFFFWRPCRSILCQWIWHCLDRDTSDIDIFTLTLRIKQTYLCTWKRENRAFLAREFNTNRRVKRVYVSCTSDGNYLHNSHVTPWRFPGSRRLYSSLATRAIHILRRHLNAVN